MRGGVIPVDTGFAPMWTRTSVGQNGTTPTDTGAGWRKDRTDANTAGIGMSLAVPIGRLAGKRIRVTIDARGNVGNSYSSYVQGASRTAITDVARPVLDQVAWSSIIYETGIVSETSGGATLPSTGGLLKSLLVTVLLTTQGWVEIKKTGTRVQILGTI
jgi:hypothetical protein